MSPSTHDGLVAGAVRIGSLGLFGLPTYLVTIRAAEILASLAGTSLSGNWRAAASVIAVVLSFEVATEVAAVRLDGFAALSRSSRLTNVVRHATLSVAVLAAFVVVADVLVYVIGYSISTGNSLEVAIGALAALAVVWALGRTLSAFYRGYRGDGR
ncbi:hypothetical protein AUR64_10210 [Haloprofundus marisrubri]|uniref:Uncharacterized protein n=1 Tax=Haloprofundus marisrubri TaxID=1514971 RepID=A0A0W1R9F6_9EURY|nr:hypothetical protein [Haloprofundus marisrubri]KTG09975.1 hypothetical protein AUR64_10210 [Haloprofundus marisrubri]